MENVLLVVESIGCVWRPQTHQNLLAGIDVYKSLSNSHAGRRTNLRTQAYSFGVSVRVELRIDVTGGTHQGDLDCRGRTPRGQGEPSHAGA